MGFLGLFAGLVLLIWLALRGINVIFASVLCSLVVIFTNDLPLAESLSQHYALGPLGAFSFAGKFFFLFATGAIFGRVMDESHAATSIALAMLRKWGKKRVLWITTLSCALLTYGGVVVFVVIFAIYPLGLRLLEQTNLPKRLLGGSVCLGAGTFTLTALPGTPSIQNVIPSVYLGTDLYAGGWLGLLGGLIMFGLGIWYLERERLRAYENGESFELGPKDQILEIGKEDFKYPHWLIASTPLITVLTIIVTPRLLTLVMGDAVKSATGLLGETIRFAGAQPILWPCIALIIGTLAAILLMDSVRSKGLKIMGSGTQDSIIPLMCTSAVIGFGGVVTQTDAFQQFGQIMSNSDLPPLLSLFAAISLLAGVTGSASGGLQIFMQTMADNYLAMGIEPEVLHRLVTMASGGLDSLPHCGGVVAILFILGLTHRQGYKDMFVLSVIIPLIASIITFGTYAFIS